MPRMLLLVASFVLTGAIRKMLVGAGLGLVSMSVISLLFERYLDRFIQYSAGDSVNIFGLLALAGVDKCLSVIIGATVARVAINAMTLTLAKAT